MNSLIEDFEALLSETEKMEHIKYAGILGLNGSVVISHFPSDLVDTLQSLILYLGVINIYTLTARVRDYDIGISRFYDYYLVIVYQEGVEDFQKILEASTKKFKNLLDRKMARPRGTHLKVYSGQLKSAKDNGAPIFDAFTEIPPQTEMTVFSTPVKKIFTLEFINNKMSEELIEKYGDWVVDLFLLIDGENNIGQLTKILKRDISEVILVIEELIKNRAVAIKRLKLNNI
ncbi:MAG: hypothetical protein QXR19_12285 [Candidatus Jordarchaeaceae archaeon]